MGQKCFLSGNNAKRELIITDDFVVFSTNLAYHAGKEDWNPEVLEIFFLQLQ